MEFLFEGSLKLIRNGRNVLFSHVIWCCLFHIIHRNHSQTCDIRFNIPLFFSSFIFGYCWCSVWAVLLELTNAQNIHTCETVLFDTQRAYAISAAVFFFPFRNPHTCVRRVVLMCSCLCSHVRIRAYGVSCQSTSDTFETVVRYNFEFSKCHCDCAAQLSMSYATKIVSTHEPRLRRMWSFLHTNESKQKHFNAFGFLLLLLLLFQWSARELEKFPR